jgi:uncharacterized protein YacL
MEQPIFIDTCALAHKITPVAYRLGYLNQAIVLRSVSREVVGLCASADPVKREAGQRAALALAKMHSLSGVTITFDDQEPWADKADEDLLLRAELDGGRILTDDGPLQSLARQRNIAVISVHDLLRQLYPLAFELAAVFPPLQEITQGGVLLVNIVKPGQKDGQGIAYLVDGRKVVVSDARTYLGQALAVQVTYIHTTDAGQQILFADPAQMSNGALTV